MNELDRFEHDAPVTPPFTPSIPGAIVYPPPAHYWNIGIDPAEDFTVAPGTPWWKFW